jgi:thioredoxin 1
VYPAGGELSDNARGRGDAAIRWLTSAELQRAVPEHGIAMIECTVPWCSAGRFGRGAFPRLSAEHPDVLFGRIDVEQELLVARRLSIEAVPTVLVIQDRALVGRYVGVLSFAALHDLLAQVRRRAGDETRGANPAAPPGPAGE